MMLETLQDTSLEYLAYSKAGSMYLEVLICKELVLQIYHFVKWIKRC